MGSSWGVLFLALLSFSAVALGKDEVGAKNSDLAMNFYKESCPQAEEIIREQVKLLYKRHKNTAFSWLRNIFHDCAVQVQKISLKRR
ncbi:putative Peroxidase 42 [Cocos nucifera]|nr:putative Peroxidase 42 [Cocos nucifera]